ncbi:MAG: hypothetical protein WBK28_03160 [Minisyncoccia bacterium]
MSDRKNLTLNRGTDIALDKDIFSKVFDKDIKRVYLYKKSERLAKAIHLVCPAFKDSRSLKEHLERISIELIEASVLSSPTARERLSRSLLSLSSVVQLGKTGGLLSSMNAEVLLRECYLLLEEIASYEDPRISLPETLSIAQMARTSTALPASERKHPKRERGEGNEPSTRSYKGQGQNPAEKSTRRDTILSIIKDRGSSYIKDISMVFRTVSEKTIQRELQRLVLDGFVEKSGDRRWTTYKIAPVPPSPPKKPQAVVDQEHDLG